MADEYVVSAFRRTVAIVDWHRCPSGYSEPALAAAPHLFQEPGALEQVAELAGTWFSRHLQPASMHLH